MKANTQKAMSVESHKRFVLLSLSDTRMDQQGAYFNGDPLNLLPAKCSSCRFPDLDFVPDPYLLLKGATKTSAEIGGSNYGYLLVKERIKAVVDSLLPGQCQFFSTRILGSNAVSPWWLMVPLNECRTREVKESIPRCAACNEPASSHGTECVEIRLQFSFPAEGRPAEIYKTTDWCSAERRGGGHQSWIHRDLLVSLRFYRLLRELKVAGVCQCGGETELNDLEKAWVGKRKEELRKASVALYPVGVVDAEAARWFKSYLKRCAGAGHSLVAVPGLEKKHKLKFPKAYLEFMASVGPQRFTATEEYPEVEVHPPEQCDLSTFRKGAFRADDEESREVDGLIFATDGVGDCYGFDLRKDRKESPVIVYRHEYGCFEPFTDNFVAFLQRFSKESESQFVSP